MNYSVSAIDCKDYSISSKLEWILPNGLGGFASGTVAGSNTRRYHGYLVAAIKPPTDRMVLLAGVETHVTIAGTSYGLSTNQYIGTVHPQGHQYLESFSVSEHAEWKYNVNGHLLTKRLKVHPQGNGCTLEHINLGSQTIQLSLRPLVSHKFYHDNFRVTDFYPQFLVFPEGQTVLTHQNIKLCLDHFEADRTPTTGWYYRFEHQREAERGLDPIDDLYCPCELRYILGPGQVAQLVASTDIDTEPIWFSEEKESVDAPMIFCLEDAASKFLVDCPERSSIIAGYPWFTDWGRDTMISLPGICLSTGKVDLARQILKSYASEMKQGLIPNRFADRGLEPEYNTADATLWFVQAIYATLTTEWNYDFANEAHHWLEEIFNWHKKGTLFGIQVDPVDGLLKQGSIGVQLTWMDAKVGDWVVTPRHGKPIEICALWINACRIGSWLSSMLGLDPSSFDKAADLGANHFEKKFWKSSIGYYLDTVEPDDASFRPNQLIAMSLPFGPASTNNAKIALEKIKQSLLTPYGLRTLEPLAPGYAGRYTGDMAQRDTTYHQGTVWPWLLGPYCSALLRINQDVEGAREALSNSRAMLESYGLGGIAEVYDGDEPHMPGGCPWQAWSVSEFLRAEKEIESFSLAEQTTA